MALAFLRGVYKKSDSPSSRPLPYLTFSSVEPFTIGVNNATKNWDGTLYYSTDTIAWNEWDGVTAISSNEYNGEQHIYMRGIGNKKITGSSSSDYRWVLTGTNIKCVGNIENLLDYKTVMSGQHVSMNYNCYSGMFYDCTSLVSVNLDFGTASIAENMFYGCTNLESVVFYNYGSCSNSAFYGCTNITTATASVSVIRGILNIAQDNVKTININDATSVSIPDEMCRDFTGLTSVTIGDGVTSIGERAFYGCTGLTSVTIGNAVTSIGYAAFRGCSRLTSIEIPDSVTSMDGDVFYGCNGLTSVTIGNGVTSIKSRTFSNCASLNSVTISNSVASIGDEAFYGCTGLISIEIPDAVKSIGDFAFHKCSNLTNVTLGNGVTSLGGEVFQSCTGLTGITIPDSVTYIGNAFTYCTGLMHVVIPNSVTAIGAAFYGCTKLSLIEYGGTKEQWNAITFEDERWNYNMPNGYTVRCTDGDIISF